MNSVYLYGLLTLTEFAKIKSTTVREYQGWMLVFLCVLTVFINIIYMLVHYFKIMYRFVKKAIACMIRLFQSKNVESDSEKAKKYEPQGSFNSDFDKRKFG